MNDDLKYWVALSLIPGFGPQRFKKLYNYFASMKDAYEAFGSDLKDAGLEDKAIEKFLVYKNKINPDFELEKLIKEKISVITIKDKKYPPPLNQIYSPPALLFYKGNIENYNEFCLAVVGSRKVSPYGRQAIFEILPPLLKSRITIVSGMALGTDSLAHQCAVENNCMTIAVLGSGLDSENIYPKANKYLIDKIISNNGMVISEFPIGTMPLKHNFPQRNRIISGLSKGVLIIEAAQNSGALITAQYALEQNKEIFSVPGSIFSANCAGTNKLIKEGAMPVLCAEDILEELNLTEVSRFIENKKIIPENPEEEALLKYLNKEPLHINALIKLTGLPINTLNSCLALMEMTGKIKNLGNMSYVVNK